MTYQDLSGVRVAVSDGVATLTIDNPPLNLLDETLILALRTFAARVRDDAAVRVIVFESADPDFFIAHGDMRFVTEPSRLAAYADADVLPGTNMMQTLHEEIRALPQVTIGKLAGFARGGGNELLMALDMRFAALGRGGQAQPETRMGIIPGGGGTQYLTALAGRARALELILGGALADPALAERYGLINRALPASDLDAFVTTLARHIATLSPAVIQAAKTAIDGHSLTTENEALTSLFTADAVIRAQRLLDAGVQTREGELRLEDLIDEVH
ncbi:enoyl-CoA hydratase/isomerase family protein [Catenuloplanes japonicus]|uniref:enoyl-CoA hydratase/isomerase family protein n=1 Tax=Catenuloplanes japonicus TaxID=33876 RepID=UPI000524D421|nr:enoyl-CoA hydratase/isomerase family protein [Catenuloplanes japonicus]